MEISLKYIFALMVISIFQIVVKCYAQPTVTIGNTTIVGIDMFTRNNRNISGFIGIPYAKPPIGELRFSNPNLKDFEEKNLSADKEGSACTQMTRYGEVIGHEDCLFLNIYTPWKSFNEGKSLLPVMVLIHGSAFLVGSSSVANLSPGYLLDKDIVYVSMNHRLNIFGFLSTGDEAALGNFGIKDQLVALQWIRKYIRHFGGDPNQVTLTGYSTGADAVLHHMFSNITEGYFNRYIIQSGCPFTARSFRTGEESAKIAKNVAEYFNCSSTDSELLVNCLRDIDYKKLVNNSAIFPGIRQIFQSTWSPTIEPKVEGAYITENPFDLLKQNKVRDLPGISGVVRDEGLTWIAPFYVDDKLYNEVRTNLDGFLLDIFTHFELTKNISTIVSKVKKFYFHNRVSRDKSVILKQLSDFVGDLFKIYPIIFSSYFYTQHIKSPLYFYYFNYRGSISTSSEKTQNNWDLGVAHTDELIYLYPRKPIVPVPNNTRIIKKDSLMTDLMVDLWTSFTINGAPTSGKLYKGSNSWRPYQPNKNVLRIGNYSGTKTKMINSLLKWRMKFWKRLQPLLIYNFLSK